MKAMKVGMAKAGKSMTSTKAGKFAKKGAKKLAAAKTRSKVVESSDDESQQHQPSMSSALALAGGDSSDDESDGKLKSKVPPKFKAWVAARNSNKPLEWNNRCSQAVIDWVKSLKSTGKHQAAALLE